MSYTAEEIADMIASGEDDTDWARVDALTEEELEARIHSDPDADLGPTKRVGFGSVQTVLDEAEDEDEAAIRVDHDILQYFKRQGADYQRRINAVLRAYVRHRRTR